MQDLRVELRPWGLDPRDVRAPTELWQGDADSWVSLDANRSWVEAVPGLKLTVLAGAGLFFPFAETARLVDRVHTLLP